MRCPKCRTLTLPPAGMGEDIASLVRCPRCSAAWVARLRDDGSEGLPPPVVARNGPLIIEADIAVPVSQARRWFGARRSRLAAGAAR